MKRAIIVAAAVLLATVARSAELPWFERYFFPIGMWCIPTNDEENWLDDDGAGGLPINDWTPPDYPNITAIEDLKFDYGRVAIPINWDIRFDWHIRRLFDYDADGVPDTTEADLWAVEDLKEIGVRSFLKVHDLNYYNSSGKECLSGACGGQDPTYPDKYPYNDWPPCVPGDYDAIKDEYELRFIDNYITNGFDDLFDEYRDAPVTAIHMDDEPRHWELLRSRVLVDLYHEHDPDKILMSHLEDRTLFQCGEYPDYDYGVPGIDNFYSFVTCHIGEKILCGLTHHMINATPANSSKLYDGHFNPGTPWSEWHYGFPSMETRLSRARETSLRYDIPYWYVPSADYVYGTFPKAGGTKRWKSPREVRANVNMSLTYGAKGIMYLGMFLPPPPPEGPNHYDTLLDNNGNLRENDYGLVTDYEGNEDPELIEITYGYYIDPQLLYNEFVSLHTKLYSVRDKLQTLTSLDAFRYDDVPRSLVCDYDGNRDRGEDDDYPPDYEDCVDFLDFGTFVCPYTGVRYFAVSDRFCNWPPATYPDPSEEDEVTVRHPGRIIFDVYDDDPDPHYFTFFNIDDLHHGDGVSTFDLDLNNADGRIFKLDPCLNYNPGFEDDEHPSTPPTDWTIGGTGSGYAITTDEEARKGDWSCKFYDMAEGSRTWIENEAELDIGDDVFAGMKYRLSGYIKCSSGSETRAKLRVMMEDTVPQVAGTYLVDGGTGWAGPAGWVYVSEDFEMPEPYENPPRGTVWTEAYVLSVGDEPGLVWFDDVRLEPLSRVFNGHFEHDGDDWWPGPVHGWGSRLNYPGQNYWRSSPGRYGDYCLKVGAKSGGNVIRNDEKLYLSKGTNYAVTGWAKKESSCPQAEVIVEFYTTKDYKFNVESHMVPTGDWQQFTIAIAPNEWTEYDFMPIPPNPGKPAYVKIACKVPQGSSGSAYFDNIELIETNLVYNGNFELAEEEPHHPDWWRYSGSIPTLPPGAPGWSALYDADSKYDRRCWRVRTPSGNINYASETFVLDPSTQYRLSGWLRNFDVELGVNKSEGCKLKINLYDSYGNSLGSYTTDKVTDTEEWTYKYVDISSAAGKRFARVVVVEEEDAYSSAADGIRVLPTGGLQ